MYPRRVEVTENFSPLSPAPWASSRVKPGREDAGGGVRGGTARAGNGDFGCASKGGVCSGVPTEPLTGAKLGGSKCGNIALHRGAAGGSIRLGGRSL